MKILLTLLALLSTTALFAGDRNSAYEAICKNMTFESERNNCIAKIRPYNYFNDTALMICAGFNFDSTKMECLGYISDKFYDNYEVETCRNSTFDSQKLACLRDNGTTRPNPGPGPGPIPTPGCISRQEALNQLRSAQTELRSGNTGTVDKRLTFLINKFQNCQ